MKFTSFYSLACVCVVLLMLLCKDAEDQNTDAMNEKPEYALVIHGGAGTITRSRMTEEKEQAYLQALNAALDIGEDILSKGGTSLDAVEQVVTYMEDSPLFNAGKGSVFTSEGVNEMDASFMDGKTLNAGAVAAVRNIRNPIQVARAVLEKSEHVMLSGRGARRFAEEQGFEVAPDAYFYTQRRWDALQHVKQKEADTVISEDKKHGTVGAVALDRYGNLAAGTSTGGRTNKKYNRVGDSPIIGAGTYADNNTCAVSSTGHGEYFMRLVTAYDIPAMMAYRGMSVAEAADTAIHKRMTGLGGTGGVIALDRNGNVAMPFNTEGMYRGYAKPGERSVKIYGQ